MSSIVTNDKMSELVDKYINKLDVNDFLSEIDFNIDKIYIDKFWNSIEHDKWLYIDDNMLIWMGYTYNEVKKSKQAYINLLNEHFNINDDYKLINNK